MNNIWKVKSTNASIPASAPVSEPGETKALTSAGDSTGTSTQVKEKGRHNSNCIPGFIFLCNGKTRPQCFQHRVFGLPMSQKKTVERIKPGTKLFLFDYDMRLLYGVYEAASEGKLNLEPAAFEGRFLAQVKFITVEECLPLPEMSFRSAIMENYYGTKFRSELSESQVKTLVSLFHSLSSSSLNPMALPMLNAAPPQTICSLQTLEPQPIQALQVMQHQKYMDGALVDHVHPSFQHQNFPSPVDSCNAHFQGLYSTRDHIQVAQEPYPRFNSEGVPQCHTMGLGNDYHPLTSWSEPLQQGRHPPEQENIWFHQQLPLFRERETTLTGTSVAAYNSVPTTCNILSSVQPRVPAYERPSPIYPVPGSYVSSTVQPHALASGRPVLTYPLPTDRYVSSTMQPIAPACGVPEPSYLLPMASHVSSTMEPYSPESGRAEENYPFPTACYASSTMQP